MRLYHEPCRARLHCYRSVQICPPELCARTLPATLHQGMRMPITIPSPGLRYDMPWPGMGNQFGAGRAARTVMSCQQHINGTDVALDDLDLLGLANVTG